VRTRYGHCSEPGFLDHAKCVRRLPHSLEFGQVMSFGCGVCKTVGSAYVGSNPTPATRVKAQVSRGVSAGLLLVWGGGLQTAPPQGSGLGGAGQRPAGPGAAGLRLLPLPMRSQPRRPSLRLGACHDGAAHERTRHDRCHRCAASSVAPQTAAPSVTERTGQSPLPPRLSPNMDAYRFNRHSRSGPHVMASSV